MTDFVHLHVHTEYSLLDGAARVEKLLKKAAEYNMKALAITDHGVMYGVVDFYKKAKKYGVKPIIGCEVYVAVRTMEDKDPKLDSNQNHLVLLAKDEEGYSNLIKLVSTAFTKGFYYKPRVDIEVLKKYSKGLIALSGCLGGEVSSYLVKRNYEKAREAVYRFVDIFGKDNFYLEIQDHGIDEQILINPDIVRLSNETGIGLVATNDVHYVEKEDSKAQDILLCIQTGKNIDDEGRMKFDGDAFYLKSGDEMKELFSYAPESITNTLKIADKCNMDFTFGQIHLPAYDVPEGFKSDSYIRYLCFENLKDKYEVITEEVKQRAEYELSVITKMGYSDYFLIVWDYVKYAKDNGIMVGPGRGSGAGSIVAFCLGITNIDPIKYNLIFERFLNPERISMPDFDIDFCYERRQEVIDYVIRKYGKERVAQIITFGTMAARAAIRDVGRALNVPYGDVDTIAKKIPFEIGMSIERALEVNGELRKLYEEDDNVKYLLDMSKAVEGMPRHCSTHAAGVVISKKAVTEYVPLQMNEDVITTQFPMGTLEELGLLKMDFLGLRTLTVIRDTLEIVKSRGEEIPDIEKLDYNEPKVYKMISEGETYGIFQLESGGMTQFMKELKPSCLEDIIAGISLYRPGPMDQIPRYIQNKNNPYKVEYKHKKLEPILQVTYGCIIYQEQVMQVFRDLAGYSLGRSDLVRRAMSKKKADVMAKERVNFINGMVNEKGEVTMPGCVGNGIPADVASKIFDELAEFAKYGFNKSHAAAYAIIAYQTGWLKYKYPVEFTAALITSVMGSSKKVAEYIHNCKSKGIEVLPPDINESNIRFAVKENKIRFGLAAVKNVGINAIISIIKARHEKGTFEDLYDFLQKIDMADVNKRTIESLIKCGAFDCFSVARSKLIAVYEKLIDSIQGQKKKNIEGQLSFFDSIEDVTDMNIIYPNLQEYPQSVLLAMEKEMLGLYISGHPLLEYNDMLKNMVSITTADLIRDNVDDDEIVEINNDLDGKKVIIGGIVVSVKQKSTKTNNLMAFVELEDMYGAIELIVFPKVYDKSAQILKTDNIVVVEGRISQREEDDAKILCSKITQINKDMGKYLNKKLYIKIDTEKDSNIWNKIKQILINYSGNQSVYVVNEEAKRAGKSSVMMVDKRYEVEISDLLINELKQIAGDDCVAVMDIKKNIN